LYDLPNSLLIVAVSSLLLWVVLNIIVQMYKKLIMFNHKVYWFNKN
jgi:hypothetical protein